MIVEHKDAVLARIRQSSALADVVFESQVTGADGEPLSNAESPEFYAVLFAGSPYRSIERLMATQTRADFDFTLHSVGRSVDQALFVAEHLAAQLLGVRLTIAGRSCWPVSFQASQPVRPDTDTSPMRYFGVDVIRVSSTPA